MNIVNEELKFKIYNILNLEQESEITEEDLEEVKNISLNSKDLELKEKIFSKKDFEALKHVETLTLNSFNITNDIIEGLNKILNLKFLILNHCKFTDNTAIENNLEKLIINYPHQLNINIFSNVTNIEMIKLINVNQIDIEELLRFTSLKKLSIYNSKILSFEKLENINKLQELNLDGSNIEDTVCTNLLNKGVNIHYSDEYLPF